jgi:hypothetical protein
MTEKNWSPLNSGGVLYGNQIFQWPFDTPSPPDGNWNFLIAIRFMVVEMTLILVAHNE